MFSFSSFHYEVILKYELRKLNFVTNYGMSYHYHICLVDKTNSLVLNYTRFEDYVSFDSKNGFYKADKTIRMALNNVCWFLNKIFIEHDFTSIEELTYNNIKAIFQTFAIGEYNKTNTPPKKETVSKRIITVFAFLSKYYDQHKNEVSFDYTANELYKQKEIVIRNNYKKTTRKIELVPNIVLNKPRISILNKNRELPESFLPCILLAARQYAPNLVLPIMLQAFCGLREGEVCNISYSQLVSLQKNYYTIDVNNLDFVTDTPIGNVKIIRRQPVYPDFKEILEKETQNYLILINQKFKHNVDLNKDNAPAFYSIQGRPLAVQTYCRYVKSLFNRYGLPKIEKYIASLHIYEHKQKYAMYIDRYKEEYPGAHMFRHFYTLYLISHIKNINAMQLMAWRGDRSMESSIAYINNKGIFMERYKEIALNLQSLIFEGELELYFNE
ncbi:hypothetical protein [Acetobacterium sp.]|uniref:hypothetical protein n=1 Tax=Acetobacterium sp. TaxID=1872094 RepID=UPI002F410BB0